MLMLMVRDLKYLAPFSIVATIIQLCVFGVVGYYVCTDLPKFCDKTKLFVGPLKVPIFFGTTVFALLAMGVVCLDFSSDRLQMSHDVLCSSSARSTT